MSGDISPAGQHCVHPVGVTEAHQTVVEARRVAETPIQGDRKQNVLDASGLRQGDPKRSARRREGLEIGDTRIDRDKPEGRPGQSGKSAPAGGGISADQIGRNSHESHIETVGEHRLPNRSGVVDANPLDLKLGTVSGITGAPVFTGGCDASIFPGIPGSPGLSGTIFTGRANQHERRVGEAVLLRDTKDRHRGGPDRSIGSFGSVSVTGSGVPIFVVSGTPDQERGENQNDTRNEDSVDP